MYYGNESYNDPISTNMLEDVRDRSQSYTNINRRKEHYKILDRINQRQSEWKLALEATQNMGKGLYQVFKTVLKDILQYLPPLGKYGFGSLPFHSKTQKAEVTKFS